MRFLVFVIPCGTTRIILFLGPNLSRIKAHFFDFSEQRLDVLSLQHLHRAVLHLRPVRFGLALLLLNTDIPEFLLPSVFECLNDLREFFLTPGVFHSSVTDDLIERQPPSRFVTHPEQLLERDTSPTHLSGELFQPDDVIQHFPKPVRGDRNGVRGFFAVQGMKRGPVRTDFDEVVD